METPVVVQRKKVGRPPKAASRVKDKETNNEIVIMQTELGNTAALVAISPVPDEPTSGVVPPGQVVDTGECRRSSRKKIIKFDVRDLLNKHRKPHKIQIEARIDSNAPSAASKTTTLVENPEKSDVGSKEKCFIEKTSIIQRSMAFEHLQHGPTQIPIPLKTEIFKPNQSSSLIVAQMESVSVSSNQGARRQSKSFGGIVKRKTTIEKEVAMPKRRGRPPKNRSFIDKPVTEIEKKSDISISTENPVTEIDIKSTVTASSELNDTQRSNIETMETFVNEKEGQKNIVEHVGETEVSQKENPTKSVLNLKAESNETNNLFDKSEKCSNDPNKMDLNTKSNNCTEIEVKPASSTIDSEMIYSVSLQPMEDIPLENNDTLHTSKTKCELTEGVEESVQIANKPEMVTHAVGGTFVEGKTQPFSKTNITLPIKKQLSKLQEVQAQISMETSEDSSVLCLTQESGKTFSELSTIKDSNSPDLVALRKTSTPAPQRNERRSGRCGRLGDDSNKTLEETFAEIAANSSKEILGMALQKGDENSLSEVAVDTLDTEFQSFQEDISESKDSTHPMVEQDSSSRSKSPQEQLSEQDIVHPKRRGRKPKPKVGIEEEDCTKLTSEIDLEKNSGLSETQIVEESIEENVRIEEKQTVDHNPTELLEKSSPYKENKDICNNDKSFSEGATEVSTSNTDISSFASSIINLNEAPKDSEIISTDESHKQQKIKEKNSEGSSASKKLSKNSSHKHRKREDHSSSSHKSERKSSKHRSLSSDTKKKHRRHDGEDVSRKEKYFTGSSKKSLSLSKKESSEHLTCEKNEKLPSSSKEKNNVSNNTEKKETSMATKEDECSNKPVLVIKEKCAEKEKRSDSSNHDSPAEEKKDKTSKRTSSFPTEKSATDILRKSTLFSPERTVSESPDISPCPAKEKVSLTGSKKSSPSSKDKSMGESVKKSTPISKEKEFIESYVKNSPSTSKIKPTEDERYRKSVFLSKEKSVDDSLKKDSLLTKEKDKCSEIKQISKFMLEKKHEKKKHRNRSFEAELSSPNLKTASSSSLVFTTPKSSFVSSHKKTDDSSHKRKRKHKEVIETSSTKNSSKDPETTDDKHKSHNKESTDTKKEARKERQKKLKEAIKAAMEEISFQKNLSSTPPEVKTVNTGVERAMTPPETHLDIKEAVLPITPGELDAVDDHHVDVPAQNVEACSPAEKVVQSDEPKDSTVDPEPDPLYDIEKFIEAGVNLLKRDYKKAEEDEEVKSEEKEKQEGNVESGSLEDGGSTEIPSTKGVAEENTSVTKDSETKPDILSALDFYETPADTPISTPTSLTPNCSPIRTDNVDTYYYSDGVRRSHRLKKITNAPKALVGRGLVRDRDRERLALRDDVETKSYYSIEDHLMDLAEVEAKNAKFLKEMEERLSNFEVIKENEYHCERVVSREARKMVCDCFLTPDEAERGELGCGEDCLNRLLMIECSANCKVGERCTNKRFQKYLCAPCRVFRTEKKGFGIMADVEIHPGEFIMEYVGEVLDSEEFEDRRVAYSQDKNRHYYFMALRSDAIIDATIKGNISRFINHSCDPNAETQKWTVNGELRVGFFSRKTIMPGEEITFDYQYQRYGREAQRCYCESANCRGWIGEEPASDEGEQIDDDEDDDDDDDEYDEDESDVVSMVKGLMSVEDGEDDDGKDDMMSEETRRSLQDAAVKAQLRKNQSSGSLETSASKEPSLEGETDESKQKFMAYLSKISAKIELHKKSVREEKKRKRRQRKKAANEKRKPSAVTGRFLEDPDLEDEVDFLSRCGLKNQSDTLRFSRLMVRAKLIPTRLNLLAILRAGELPCRRLFLDYHGLHLLHGWINEDGRTDMTLRLALLETLECLPIANKTILTDSKVYQSIRSWCKSETLPPSCNTEGNSSSPSDDSSKESATGNAAEKQAPNADVEPVAAEDNEPPKTELEKLALKLLSSWDNLPEIFRIPKRERIEQMKEHEREADRQYAATVEASNDEDQKETGQDRYQRDRFERRFGRPQGARSITVLGSGAVGVTTKRLVSSDVLSPEDTKHLSKEQRRELFAAKVARDEAEKRQAERHREFITKCSFFGIDPINSRAEDMPFCVSDSGQWYNEKRQQIATPPAFAHVQTPVKPMSTNPTDYYLPSAATKLPSDWAFAITEQGKIYYYHLKHRIPQWEPPSVEQINNTNWSDEESESEEDETGTTEELSEERIKEIEAIETQDDLNAFLKKIVQEQRQSRYKRLVDERPISPRREEDRIYNQMEMRKYKENKEKIKKRKEEIRRRRSEAIKNSMINMCTLGSLEEKPSTSAAAALTLSSDIAKSDTDFDSDMPEDALPIQDYLLSSDEENNDIDEMKAECNNSPLLDKIVQGDKIVDELDALTTKRQLKRALPPHRELNFDLNLNNSLSSENLLSNIEKLEHKKRKQEKKDKSKRSKESSDAKYRKLKEKFRTEIAGIIVQHLKPYRKDTCVFGRIKSNDDFKHLAKKLTHFVMIKELKYCESVGQTLVVTESVKNKSREFIRKYMAKYEAGYVKPDNDPEFKDIPFTL